MNTDSKTLASPTVSHIADAIAQRIASGVYKSGQWLPSERSLGDEFGVSRIVVRQAIKEVAERDLVVCYARCRPMVRAAQAAPVSNLTARRTIGLWIWPNPSSQGPSLIVRGIRHALDHDDFRLVLDSAVGDNQDSIRASEAAFLRRITQDNDVEGLVLWYLGDAINRGALEDVRAAGIPMVFIDRRPPAGFDADYVGVDNVRAAQQIVKHLISLGHVNIAHITNVDTASTVSERLEGYRRALTQAGIDVRPELILHDTGEDYRGDAQSSALIEALLAVRNPATAVFAVNDLVALRSISALRAHGVRIPEDIAVAGFDGIERWTPGVPFLSTMEQPFEEIGSHAVEILLERVGGEPARAYRHVLLDARLSIGPSTVAGESRTRSGDQGMRVRPLAVA